MSDPKWSGVQSLLTEQHVARLAEIRQKLRDQEVSLKGDGDGGEGTLSPVFENMMEKALATSTKPSPFPITGPVFTAKPVPSWELTSPGEENEGDVLRWGNWLEVDGVKYCRAYPPKGTSRGGPAYYMDEAGGWYSLASYPGAVLTPIETPAWYSPEMGGPPPCDEEEAPVTGETPNLSYQWGEWTEIGGVSYREVIPPEPLQGGTSRYYMNEEGDWFRLRGTEGAALEPIEPPKWFAGWTPVETEPSDGLRQALRTFLEELIGALDGAVGTSA